MSISLQKGAIILVVVILVGYGLVTVYQAGGVGPFYRQFVARMQPKPAAQSVSPAPSETATLAPTATASASIVPQMTPSRTPAPTAQPLADQILAAMNSRRAASGAAALTVNATLRNVAQAQAADMAAKGYFSHTRLDGTTFQQRISASGYHGTAEAENIGLTTDTAVTIVDGWMNSDAHRTNMLNTAYVAAGVGTARGLWQGQSVTFIVAVFGSTK